MTSIGYYQATSANEGPSPAPQRRSIARRAGRFIATCAVVYLILTSAISAMFQWVTPSFTAFMLTEDSRPIYQFVSLDHVSRYMLSAVLVHEDINLGPRVGGFDIAAFVDRAQGYLDGEPNEGGSTIPQQLAKNIYLYREGGWFRKAIEAPLSFQLAWTISDRRLLELYLNYAQFGPELYGICAATWYYFDEPPWDMTEYQAAQLVGLLPLPNLVQRQTGGGIYLGYGANPVAVDLINGSANFHVPDELARNGGWESVLETISITDTAADHAGERREDSCSVMPATIAARLRGEDPWHTSSSP